MAVFILKTWDGREITLPTPLAWRLDYGLGTPCDSFWVKFLWAGGGEDTLAAGYRMTVVEDTQPMFTGVVDECVCQWTEDGCTAEISGRGMQALLLDNQAEAADYQVATRIESVGAEIESIDYLDLDDQPGKDLLVSWQASASVHTLVGYALVQDQTLEILRSGYSRYLTGDLDGDSRQEVILSQTEGASRLRLEYYDGQQGTMELVNTAQVSEGATDISSWTVGKLAGDTPALFVTSFLEKDLLVTDVFTVGQEGLKNITLDPATRSSPAAYRYSAGVRPGDRNGDGVTEVPAGVAVDAYGESTVDQFWWLDWMRYRADGAGERVMTTYQSTDGSWYLEIPDQWTGKFAMNRQESAAEGVRSVTFARVTRSGEDPFLTIRCLVGGDRAEHARQAGQYTLYADNTTVYTAQFLDTNWDCGLDEQELALRFHVGSGPWTDDAQG